MVIFNLWPGLPTLSLLLTLHAIPGFAQGQGDVFNYIDSLIGSSNGGNVFAGATLPFGMAKASPDTDSPDSLNNGGYTTDGANITGFSHLHDSGTGGLASFGNFPFWPATSCKDDIVSNCKFPKLMRRTQQENGTVNHSPGYFDITIDTGVRVEMTVTNHTALYRVTFPNTTADGAPASPLILFDLSDLSDSRGNGSISVDPKMGSMRGNGTFNPSFGVGTYDAHFCADFAGAEVRDTGIWVNDRPTNATNDLFITHGGTFTRSLTYPLPGGAWTRFAKPQTSDNSMLIRVGVSFKDVNKACHSAQSEIPDFDFEGVKKQAEDVWRKKLSPIQVTKTGGVGDDFLTNFWSGVYRTLMTPMDYTGENPTWKDDEVYYDSFYCIWDSFRAQHPFLTVFDPVSQTRMLQALTNIYKHDGFLPDCRMSLCRGYTQGGSNADILFGDAWVKNLRDGIDWPTVYEAVVNDAEVEPLDWATSGRGGHQSWKSLNYIPAEDLDYIGFGVYTRSVSRTLEYAYNDFCIAEIAEGLNKTADAEKYYGRSSNWKNLYKQDQTSFIANGTQNTGFTGFFQPKYLNQTWAYQDPILCSQLDTNGTSCSIGVTSHESYEGSLWEYAFFAPGDMSALIATMGGPESFTKRLNFLHDSGIQYIGNEPAFLTVFQYHYSGRPGLSSNRSHFYIPSQFSPTPSGLPGNDDSGAMGAFVAFNFLGLFPNPGQNVYLISAPYFEETQIKNPITGKTAIITTQNFDKEYRNVFIQSAMLNGEEYTRNWIGHEFFLEGGTLELVLGANESSWGTREEDLPPSLSVGRMG